jgi:hypothetical protein
MALEGAGANQFGYGKLNMWAMLRSLVFNGVAIVPFSGTPTNGTSGSFANYAGPGSLLIDITTGTIYRNSNTKASPVWSALSGPVANGAGGLGAVGNAKMTYDFAVDGGAIGPITPTNSPTLPIGAIILGGTIDITTPLTSSGAATIAVGLGTGAQVAALKAATAVASYTAGQMAVIPVFTAATYVKVAAATALTLTVAAFALTAGKFDVNVVYVQGNT